MPLNKIVTNSIYGEIDLDDKDPTVVPVTYNGQRVDKIEIPEGTTFYISDVLIGVVPVTHGAQKVDKTGIPDGTPSYTSDAPIGMGFVYWTIEVDRGSGFAPVATFGFVVPVPDYTGIKKFKNSIAIKGGLGVAMRLITTALQPPQRSYINLQGYSSVD